MRKLPPAAWRAAIPRDLQVLDRWVGRVSKTPLHPLRETGAKAGVPATWGTFEEAAAFYERRAADPDCGAGFEFLRDDGLIGIDLDLALDEAGGILPWAAPLIADFEVLGGAFIERSPSGRGLHVICRGYLPRNPNRVEFGGVTATIDGKEKKSGVEVYVEKRYLTVTGDLWQPCDGLADHGAAVTALLAATGLAERMARQDAPAAAQGAEPHRLPEVRDALTKVDPDLPYPEWIEVGMAIKAGLGEAGRPLWIEWCEGGTKYIAGEPEEKWASFGGSGVGLGSLFKRALDEGWAFPEIAAADEFAGLGDDFDDLLGTPGIGDGFPNPDVVPYHQTKKGIVRSSGNVTLFFSREKEWRSRLRFNIRRGVELDGELLNDAGYTRLGTIVERALGFDSAAAIDHVYRGVEVAARLQEYDPICEYLTAVPWDGVRRIDEWLVRSGAPDTRENRMIARRFLIGAAGRALLEPQPGREPLDEQGTKMDYVVVFESEQGKKKSWLCEALCPPGYFFDSHFDFTHRISDFYQALGTNFIVEMAELDALSRAEVTTVKAIITSRVDTYRPPYGRTMERHPRRSVMVGTTNEQEWNRDMTGARRFWPVSLFGCEIDVSWVLANRQQLWAEAVHAYRAGECYWEDEPMRILMDPLQAARADLPGWLPLVEEFIAEPSVVERGFVTSAFLVQGLRFLAGLSQNVVGRGLRKLGLESKIVRLHDGSAVRVWVLPNGPKTHAELVKRIEANPDTVDGDFKVLP